MARADYVTFSRKNAKKKPPPDVSMRGPKAPATNGYKRTLTGKASAGYYLPGFGQVEITKNKRRAREANAFNPGSQDRNGKRYS